MKANQSKAYATTRILQVLIPGSVAHAEIRKLLNELGFHEPQVQDEPTSDPQLELVGLNECLERLGKVHPAPGSGGAVRDEIQRRIDAAESTPATYDEEPASDG